MQYKPLGHQFLSVGMQQVVFSVYTCWRLFCLLIAFAPLVLTAPFALSTKWRSEKWCHYLRKMLEWCGPAFIKWGQWAATRRDLFPNEVCQELEKLQVQAPAHSFELTRDAIKGTFGFPLEDLFSSFEREPVASGSIGQVHKAVIGGLGAVITGRPAGTTVAVKVRHPNVDLAFERDVSLMLMLAHWVCKLPYVKGLKLEETLKQFAGPMREQVDLCIEAANLRCFRYNFRKMSSVKFPEPLFPLVAPNILVETFHEGNSIQEIVNGPRSPAVDCNLAELGSSTFFDMLLVHNLLHADLHPGNILVERGLPDGVFPHILGATSRKLEQLTAGMDPNSIMKRLAKWTADIHNQVFPLEYHIVLLDAGMAAQLTDEERKLMIKLFQAFANKDGTAAAEATLKLAGPAQTCPDAHAFHCDMQEHFRMMNASETWDGSPFESGVDALAHVLDLVRRHQVVLPGEICSCLFTVFVLEGWSSKLDPMHSVMDQVQDLVRRWDRGLKGLIGNTMEKQWLPGDQRLAVA
ncbi:unnamed protein product [Ostreobium quekettii]|uniref:ABC1 atypical kinase-like domain-containing protein n=1 Tax=Ostreobium quekettii TaxID=121088 RepID=A0A8S1JDU8_9CHLO|nr:unnamed protein product [Ostreobium quekettii]